MTGREPDAGSAGAVACSTDGECLTCGDVAVPLTVVALAGADARCRDAEGREETVALEFVGPIGVGDRLLVHAGVAIETLTAEAFGSAEAAGAAEPAQTSGLFEPVTEA